MVVVARRKHDLESFLFVKIFPPTEVITNGMIVEGQIPSNEPSRFVQARIPALCEVDIRKFPGVGKPHVTIEAYMEAKAKHLGGAPLRKIFFKYLGWARAQVNTLYPRCSNQMRSYLSDFIAWDQFCKYF